MQKNIIFSSLLLMALTLGFTACERYDVGGDSKVQDVILPYIHEGLLQPAYVYGVGQSSIITDIPDVVAIAVDTVFGFDGGYGGKTGADTFKIKKADILSWPDTTGIGGYSLKWEKFNKGGYKVGYGTAIVIAGQIANPGTTALEGNYKRTSNGYVITIKKVFPGVYVIDNPGGAGVTPFPYLLYNYKNGGGQDSLAFPIQSNECGGGTQLVGPASMPGLKASEYSATLPPVISATTPLTFKWKVYTYGSASPNAVAPAGALCTWGNTAVRTFEKQ
jgi:hypothetical protein